MSDAIIIFGSTMGNTKTLSDEVAKGLAEGGLKVTVKDVFDAKVEELNQYEMIVLGCSTWGYGSLQDDFIDFYENMIGLPSLEGKKAAVFGPGDRDMYPDTFCKAVDSIEKRLKELGAELLIESLKVDGEVDNVLTEARGWGLEIANTYSKRDSSK